MQVSNSWIALGCAVLLTACNDTPAHTQPGSSVGDDTWTPITDSGPGDTGVGEADDDDDDGGDTTGVPGHHDEGDADPPRSRRLRRLSADQFHRSLVAATGQAWSSFDQYAAAMGRPNYADITEQALDLSVTFDKFVHDAAAASCSAAVADDLLRTPDLRVILRNVELADRDVLTLRANLDYLYLRFLAQQPGSDDPRIDPWLVLLTEPLSDGEGNGDGEIDDAQMQQRWVAVCIGLVTHTDFLSY